MNCALSAGRSLSVSACRSASYIGKKKNYYEVLGVPSTATADDIKRAFVKKSNQLHPDRGGRHEEKDRRVGWSRESSTEKFMLVKEAYDCLRRPERRRAYDDDFLRADGFLMEATSARFRDTIVDLNKQRNESYVGPGKAGRPSAAHFRDPEQEYDAERAKNRSLYLIGAIFMSAIVANIAYVSYLQRKKSPLNR